MSDAQLQTDRSDAHTEALPAETARASDPAAGAPPAQGSQKDKTQRSLVRRHPFAAALVVLALIGGGAAGVMWWLNARHFESTDDAYVDARNVTISPQVTGAIVMVPVIDNQLVQTDGLLVQIDPRDYEAAVKQAQAQIDQGNAAVANLDAQIDAQKARIDQAEKQIDQTRAALNFAKQENDRATDLVRRGAGTQQQAQQNFSNLVQAQANLASAQANATASQKQIPVLQSQRDSAVAQLEQSRTLLTRANINLQRTRLTAPEPGRATKITAAVGAATQPGQVLMMFVPENKWITANYKETQLTDMRPGQPVAVTIDAYPGRKFDAHVDSIQAGSGAAFSLLPPENATGNFVKVVQRVPVKIVFDKPPEVYIGPGMSVVPSVKVR